MFKVPDVDYTAIELRACLPNAGRTHPYNVGGMSTLYGLVPGLNYRKMGGRQTEHAAQYYLGWRTLLSRQTSAGFSESFPPVHSLTRWIVSFRGETAGTTYW